MSELRSVVDVLRSEVLANMPDARLEEDFAELQRSCEQLEVERLRRLAEIERRATFKRDGHLSAASWLAGQFKVGWGTARESVRTARALEEMLGDLGHAGDSKRVPPDTAKRDASQMCLARKPRARTPGVGPGVLRRGPLGIM